MDVESVWLSPGRLFGEGCDGADFIERYIPDIDRLQGTVIDLWDFLGRCDLRTGGEEGPRLLDPIDVADIFHINAFGCIKELYVAAA